MDGNDPLDWIARGHPWWGPVGRAAAARVARRRAETIDDLGFAIVCAVVSVDEVVRVSSAT